MATYNLPEDWLVRTVTACQTGDELARRRAWDELARKLLPVIKWIAIQEQHRLWFDNPSKHTAEDAAMEAFVSLYRHIDRIVDASGLMKWLTRVIQNKLRDMARSFEIRVLPIDDAKYTELFDGVKESLYPSDHDDLHRAIRSLSSTKRRVILLRYWHDLTPTEIAEQDGSVVGSVKKRLEDARLDLWYALQKDAQ